MLGTPGNHRALYIDSFWGLQTYYSLEDKPSYGLGAECCRA